MRRLLIAAVALVAAAGCLPFKDDGVYACNTETGEDCVTCDATTGWCRDITGIAAGATYLSSISGAGSDAIWAVGANGVILRWNGTRWVDQSTGTSSLSSVWAASPTDVFAVGSDYTWLHYDGSDWSIREENKVYIWPPVTADTVTVWNFSAVGGFSDGGTGIVWALDPQGMVNWLCDSSDNYTCDGAWPSSAPQAQSYWALYGVIQDGMVPVAVTGPGVTPSNWVNLWGAWADSTPDSYFIGRHGAIVRDTKANGDWDTVDVLSMPDPAKADLFAIWGDVLTGNFVAVGETGNVVLYRKGTGLATWTQANVSGSDISADLFGVCGTSFSTLSADVYAVGTNGLVLHWDGTTWTSVPQPYQETLLSCYATGGDLFAVSDEGAVLHLKR